MIIKVSLLITIFFVVLASLSNCLAYSGHVIWVNDGDTLKVLDENWEFETIRLYGIDCPETNQPYGFRATWYTFYKTIARKVKIIPIERDQYKRLVAKIIINKDCFNHKLIKKGYAWVYDQYCNIPECEDFERSENQARNKLRGLWQQSNPIPPWLWRRGERPSSGWRFW